MADLLPGEHLAGFEIIEQTGRDEISVVYRALDPSLQRVVVLRVMAPDVSQDESFRRHFTHEAQLAASVDHPGVVTVYRFGEADGQLYMVMRHVEARTLASVLAEGPLSTDRASAIVSAVADALDAMHAAGVVHRNVRPVNVLLGVDDDGRDRVWLAGFGSSQPGTRTSLNAQDRLGGSVAYAAPELLQDQPVSAATDVYSLACVLFACLTGQPPFPRPSHAEAIAAHLEAKAPSVSAIRPDLPSVLDVLFDYALAKDPAARYQSAGELARAMRPTLAHDVSSTPTTVSTPVPSDSVPTYVPTPVPRTPTGPVPAVAPAAGPAAAPAVAAPPSPAVDGPRRSRVAMAVVAVFVLVVAAAGAGIVLTRRTTESSLRLNVAIFPNGVKAERTWTIDGSGGNRFTGVVTLRNITNGEVTHAFNEFVPKDIAADASALTFDPAPSAIVEPDPVVRWCVTLPPFGAKTITYGAAVAHAEVTEQQLRTWADTWSKVVYKLDPSKGQQCDKTDPSAAVPINQLSETEQVTNDETAAGTVPGTEPTSETSAIDPTATTSVTTTLSTTPTTRPPVTATTSPTNTSSPTWVTTTVRTAPPAAPGAPSNPVVSNPVPDTNLANPYCGGVPQTVTVTISWSAGPGGPVDNYDVRVNRYAYTGGPEQLLQANVATSSRTSATSIQLQMVRSDPAQSYYVYEVTAHNISGQATSRAKVSMPNVVGVCSWTMWQMLRVAGLPPFEDQTVAGTDENRVYNQTLAPGTVVAAGTVAEVKSYKSP